MMDNFIVWFMGWLFPMLWLRHVGFVLFNNKEWSFGVCRLYIFIYFRLRFHRLALWFTAGHFPFGAWQISSAVNLQSQTKALCLISTWIFFHHYCLSRAVCMVGFNKSMYFVSTSSDVCVFLLGRGYNCCFCIMSNLNSYWLVQYSELWFRHFQVNGDFTGCQNGSQTLPIWRRTVSFVSTMSEILIIMAFQWITSLFNSYQALSDETKLNHPVMLFWWLPPYVGHLRSRRWSTYCVQ